MTEASSAASECNTARLSEDAPAAQAAVPPFYAASLDAAWQLTLSIQDECNTSLHLHIHGQAVIGRPDESDGFRPEIDTTPFNGRDKGISRRHAEFVILDGQLHVRDLGSTNGTRLNGQLLQPRRPYRLREGDLLQLGNLHLRVKLSAAAQ